MPKVFDSSAVLAFLYNELGAREVAKHLEGGIINAVNASEVVLVLLRNQVPGLESPALAAMRALRSTGLRIVPFEIEHLEAVPRTFTGQPHSRALSLGDRVCLATALAAGLPVLTADRAWARLQIPGLVIEFCRG